MNDCYYVKWGELMRKGLGIAVSWEGNGGGAVCDALC